MIIFLAFVALVARLATEASVPQPPSPADRLDLVDSADGKAATAKNPRKWPTLFGFRATLIEPPRPGASVPPVRITLPDGGQG